MRRVATGRVRGAIGYSHPDYAEALAEFGAPRELPRSGGWILQRQVPGFASHDAMGCYPLFACRDWSLLHSDLEDLGSELVSLSVVTDPFGEYDPDYLRQCFKDVVVPFKEHYAIDLSRPPDEFVCSHHRRSARKALRDVSVERCQDPTRLIGEWVGLYAHLIERHSVKGISAFSAESFARQLQVPGIVAFRAAHKDRTVGMTLWYLQGEVGYYHLGAYNARGYELRASFALFWVAIEHFAAHGLSWLNLGAGAGLKSNGAGGLSRFKAGWSNCTRTAYFCGRVFNREKYLELVTAQNIPATDYFPAYRLGEFQ